MPYKDDVVWCLVCGSYVTWDPSKHSDIDVHFILNAWVDYRTRYNKIIDWFLIEAFFNPKVQIEKYFENSYQKLKRLNDAHMFHTWEILFDNTWELLGLKSLASEYLSKEFKKEADTWNTISKYYLWDDFDNLEEVYNSWWEEFEFVYYNFLNKVFTIYSRFIWYPTTWIHKIKRFLVSESDKKKYGYPDFPDEQFKNILLESLDLGANKEKLEKAKELSEHVMNKMWWFDVDGWWLKWTLDI